MNNKGVSLMSLIITIIIIIILAAISMLNSNKSLEEANKAKFEVDLKSVVELLNIYNERAVIRGVSNYDKDDLTWDGSSERAENTARIEDKTKEDTIKYIFDGNNVPDSLKGLITIEAGKIRVDETRKPQYDWAVEMYSYMGE